VEERFNIAIKDRQVTPDRVVPDMQKSIGAGDRTYGKYQHYEQKEL